ncbi:hypothetical protein OG978_47405 (plasmid) [Streptomyces sp. NBC_01591]|uniref:hypothetical protein n=1 Tax=Streptomyces sp. NBC_01591 TaxID=2975888 RepID=UPI002DD8140C|nr:hypothetical protein [Streptomyces sp. NBC_01591]WSD66004.1 hypothetical protein OG978_00015 [Streptomyces sp. NBC_01591]WSD73115.1 hypothetical protein OG978_40810 [Streptomyces sp. NBC_01591]WSD73612.1 hypothetical protein OG978_40835 [Streptomyces sp. NBC_01591]WSD74601.1 hypothetical protein OG978_47405 [Streptomyces sp. NBC_01591]
MKPPRTDEAAMSSVVLSGRTQSAPAVITPSRFGMAQAIVLVAFVTAAVVLCLAAHMPVNTVYDVLLLLGGAGSIGVAVLLAAGVSDRRRSGNFLRRIVTAVLNNGSGS